MTIWTYSDSIMDFCSVAAVIGHTRCPFCRSDLDVLEPSESEEEPGPTTALQIVRCVRVCAVCGWWAIRREELTVSHERLGPRLPGRFYYPLRRHPGDVRVYGAAARLKQLDLTDLSLPVAVVRDYLAAKFKDRFSIHPRKFEEVVASVFGDLGYRVRVTAYSGDDGIDVILDRGSNEVVGVQVKRHRGKIDVEQIRSLAGALILNGITEGIFVTTSSFQSGAERTVHKFRERGVPIQLIDAPRFLEALHIAQRTRYTSRAEDGAPFQYASTILLHGTNPEFLGLADQPYRAQLERNQPAGSGNLAEDGSLSVSSRVPR